MDTAWVDSLTYDTINTIFARSYATDREASPAIGTCHTVKWQFCKSRIVQVGMIIPRMEERIRMDTAWVDSLTYDTIVERKYMHYLPDDLVPRILFDNKSIPFIEIQPLQCR